MIAQIFNPIAELAIPTAAQTNEPNAKVETQQVNVEARISKCSA